MFSFLSCRIGISSNFSSSFTKFVGYQRSSKLQRNFLSNLTLKPIDDFKIIKLNATLQKLKKKGDIKEMLNYFEKNKAIVSNNFFHNITTYNILIGACSMSNECYESTFFYIEEMKNLFKKLDDSTYLILIDSLGKQGKLREMELFFNELQKKSSNLHTLMQAYTAKLNAYIRFTDETTIKNFIYEMRASQIPFDIITYTSMIDWLGKSRMPQEVHLIIKEIQEKKIEFTQITYNCVISAFSYSKDWDSFFHYIQAARLKNMVDRITFHLMIQGYGIFCRSEYLENILFEMRDANIVPNLETFNHLIQAYARCLKLDKVISLLCSIEMRGIPLTVNTVGYALFFIKSRNIPENQYQTWLSLKSKFDKKFRDREEAISIQEREELFQFLRSFPFIKRLGH